MSVFTENNHVVMGLAPVADAFAGATVYSDVIRMRAAGHITFLIVKGAEATGTSTVTVQACDNATPSTTSAIAFKYRYCPTGDTWGALTAATTAGFVTTAAGTEIYAIEVDADDLGRDGNGYGWVRLKMAESANDPVTGCIIAILSGLTYAEDILATQIA